MIFFLSLILWFLIGYGILSLIGDIIESIKNKRMRKELDKEFYNSLVEIEKKITDTK